MNAREEIRRHPGVLATADAEIAILLDSHRTEVLAEAAAIAEKFTERWPDMDAMKADGIIGAFTALGALADELRRMANAGQVGKDTREGESTRTDDPAALLALAVVLEIPRPGILSPLQLRLSDGHADRWAICDRTGRRWYPEGWMYEPMDDRLCDDGRFTLAEAVPLARQLAEGGKSEPTPDPGPATVEFTDGTITLTSWSLTQLAPDYYGVTFMQIGGWLPEDWEPGSISQGTNHMVRADLPGTSAHAHNINVQIEVKGYGRPQRFMKIQWRHAYDPAKDHRRTGGDA